MEEYMSIAIGVIAAIAMVFVFSYGGFGPSPHIVAECDAKGGILLKGYMPRTGKDAAGCFDIKNLELK